MREPLENQDDSLSQRISSDDQYKQAFKKALKLLKVRDYSSHALQTKLVASGASFECAKSIIEQLSQEGLYRSDLYLRARIRGLARKGQGPRLIASKLLEEKIEINESQILEILEEEDLSYKALLEDLAKKKWPLIKKKVGKKEHRDHNWVAKKYLERYLLDRGHEYDEVLDIVKNI